MIDSHIGLESSLLNVLTNENNSNTSGYETCLGMGVDVFASGHNFSIKYG